MSTPRRQHYVWRSYLEAWATDEKIFCLQDHRIFSTNVSNVAVEKDFYKLQELTKEDLECVKGIIDNADPAARPVLEGFLAYFGFPGGLQANADLIGNSELEAQVRHEIISAEEKYHASLERDMVPIIASLRRRDALFYDDDKQCEGFLYFLCVQYLRTKRMRDQVAPITTRLKGFNVDWCWNVLRHIFAANLGCSLYRERKRRSLLILENDTSSPFITGDQPIINLLASSKLLAFYYPLSPTTAIILDEVKCRCGYTSGQVSIKQVAGLNRRIYQAAQLQVYGSSKEVLESLQT